MRATSFASDRTSIRPRWTLLKLQQQLVLQILQGLLRAIGTSAALPNRGRAVPCELTLPALGTIRYEAGGEHPVA